MDKEINIQELMRLTETLHWKYGELLGKKHLAEIMEDEGKTEIAELRKLRDEAAAPVKAELDRVQKGLSARIIYVDNIIEIIDIYSCELGISKTAMDGITLSANIHAGEGVHNYPYYREPESTWFDARFKAGSWRITNIYRDRCGMTRIRAMLPEKAKKALAARFERISA